MYIILTSAQSPHGKCGHVHCAEGDMRVYGIAVLSFFSSGISVILILICGMRFFILFVYGIRQKKIVHGIAVPFNFTPLSNTG